MKKVMNEIAYKCEICGRLYDDEETANKCEEMHAPQLPIAKLVEDDWPGRYPEFVTIKFTDGKLLIYRMLK